MEIELVVVPLSSFNLMSYVISIFDMCIYLNNIITLTVTYTCGIMCVN